MPRSSKQLKVFLCHSSGDKPIVRELYDRLIAEGWIDPWLDAEKLIPGQDWNFEIEKAVDEADIILVFLTNNSVNKEGYVQRELRIVLDLADYKPEGTLFVIPVRLEECDPPRRLRSWQYADYFPSSNRPAAYKKLIASLKMRADKLGISTNIPHTIKEKSVSTSDEVSQPIATTPDDKQQIMFDYASLRLEGRYGVPTADQILFNRFYTIGYSYTFRQAKWALEIVDPDKADVERFDSFRPDLRIPEMFRADHADYEGSGFDRGSLVASVNQAERPEIDTSETFLLSNMCPMEPAFNRGIWKELKEAVRELNAKRDVVDTYVICGPIFNNDQAITTIKPKGNRGVSLPIPHAFFKSVLTENRKGQSHMWSFIIPNEGTKESLEKFLIPTIKVERYSSLVLWQKLVGSEIEKEKSRIRPMWNL